MAIIQPTTGLHPYSVVWEKDPRPMVSDIDRQLVLMSLKSSDYLGASDDQRLTYVPGLNPPTTATFTQESSGPRTLVIQLKCESYDYNVEAYETLERVRTLLNKQSELEAIGLSFATSKLIIDLPTSYDNRVVNVAILEITLNAVATQTVQTQVGQGWIDTVDNSGGPVGSSDIPVTALP